VVIATAPVADASPSPGGEDALGCLQRLSEDPTDLGAASELLGNDLGDFLRKLPHEVRAETDDAALKAAIDGDYAGLVKEVSGYLTALITEGGK
jgi:hypothetical protein